MSSSMMPNFKNETEDQKERLIDISNVDYTIDGTPMSWYLCTKSRDDAVEWTMDHLENIPGSDEMIERLARRVSAKAYRQMVKERSKQRMRDRIKNNVD